VNKGWARGKRGCGGPLAAEESILI
jgi:hypothetical protein